VAIQVTTENRKLRSRPSFSGVNFKLNKEWLAACAGWEVEGRALRQHPDKKTILNEAENLINTPNQLIERTKIDPSVMETDNGVIVALKLLSHFSCAPKSERSKQAADILRAIGRLDLLPRTAGGRPETNKTLNLWLYFWRYEPEDLIDAVNDYKVRLLYLLGKCPEKHGRRQLDAPNKVFTPKGRPPIYECCIEHAFTAETGEPLPKEFDSYMSATPDLSYITLLFFHYKFDVPFWKLLAFYRRINEKRKFRFDRKVTKETKLESELELKIARFPPHRYPFFDFNIAGYRGLDDIPQDPVERKNIFEQTLLGSI